MTHTGGVIAFRAWARLCGAISSAVLQDVGYTGAMSMEQEDPLYGGETNPGPDFSPMSLKMGFIMAKRYLVAIRSAAIN